MALSSPASMERVKKYAIDVGAGRHSEGNVAQSACHVNFREFASDFADGVEESQSVFLAGCDRHRQRIEIQLVVRHSQLAGFAEKPADDD